LSIRKWLRKILEYIAYIFILVWGFSFSEELIKYVTSGSEYGLVGFVFLGLPLITVPFIFFKIKKEKKDWRSSTTLALLFVYGLGVALAPFIRIMGLQFWDAHLVLIVLVIVGLLALSYYRERRKA
jgi:O-antigen ligase